MAQVDLLNTSGKVVGQVTLLDSIFAAPVNRSVMHTAVVTYLANQRQGTKSAKTRAEVRGGGIKPRPQKGSGRARQGSIRSPQWKGGGVVFAPKPRDFSIKINKKVKRLALKSALSAKFSAGEILVLDELKLDAIKTKALADILKRLNSQNALVVIDGHDQNVILSARNIAGVKTSAADCISTYDVLKYEKLILTKAAVEKIEEVWA